MAQVPARSAPTYHRRLALRLLVFAKTSAARGRRQPADHPRSVPGLAVAWRPAVPPRLVSRRVRRVYRSRVGQSPSEAVDRRATGDSAVVRRQGPWRPVLGTEEMRDAPLGKSASSHASGAARRSRSGSVISTSQGRTQPGWVGRPKDKAPGERSRWNVPEQEFSHWRPQGGAGTSVG